MQSTNDTDITRLIGEHRAAKHAQKRAQAALAIGRMLLERNSLVHQQVDKEELRSAARYASEAENLAKERALGMLELDSSILRAHCLKLLGERAEALQLLQTSERLVDEGNAVETRARYSLLYSELLLHTGEVSEALLHAQEAARLSEATTSTKLRQDAAFNLAKVCRELGEFSQAFQNCSKALSIALESNSPNIGSYYLELGIVCILLDDSVKGLEFIERAESFFRSTHNQYGLVFVFQARGVQYCNSGKLSESLIAHTECVRLAELCQATTGRQYLGLGDLHHQLGNYETAISCYENARSIARAKGDSALLAYIGRYLAAVFIDCDRDQEAEETLNNCLTYYQEHFESAPEYSAIYPLLSRIAERKQDHAQSLDYYKKYHHWRERVRDHQLEQSLIQEKHNLEVERAAREREEFRVKALELEQTLREKRGEVAALAIALSQKNEVIEHLHQQIKVLSVSHDNDRKSSCEKMISEIDSLRQSGKQQWVELQQRFQSVDASFQTRLLSQFPTLSQIEMRVCLLMRLNMTSKDIANILWCSARTVETHRYTIRKKLLLGREDNLHNYISRL